MHQEIASCKMSNKLVYKSGRTVIASFNKPNKYDSGYRFEGQKSHSSFGLCLIDLKPFSTLVTFQLCSSTLGSLGLHRFAINQAHGNKISKPMNVYYSAQHCKETLVL